MRQILPAVLLVTAMLAVTACGSPRITTNGFVFAGLDTSFVTAGETRCLQVLQNLGTPTLVRSLSGGALGPDVWFYMGQRTSFYAYHEPEIIEEQVFALHFAAPLGSGETICGEDPEIAKVEHYTLADRKLFSFNEEITQTVGNERSFLQQLLGDLGRFSRPQL